MNIAAGGLDRHRIQCCQPSKTSFNINKARSASKAQRSAYGCKLYCGLRVQHQSVGSQSSGRSLDLYIVGRRLDAHQTRSRQSHVVTLQCEGASSLEVDVSSGFHQRSIVAIDVDGVGRVLRIVRRADIQYVKVSEIGRVGSFKTHGSRRRENSRTTGRHVRHASNDLSDRFTITKSCAIGTGKNYINCSNSKSSSKLAGNTTSSADVNGGRSKGCCRLRITCNCGDGGSGCSCRQHLIGKHRTVLHRQWNQCTKSQCQHKASDGRNTSHSLITTNLQA
jgi:hypothetical protein